MDKASKAKVYVEVTALWGNDDAESTIKVSRRRWGLIRAGDAYRTPAWSWYEGKRYSVTWLFANGRVSIDGVDGMQCITDQSIDELTAEIITSNNVHLI